MPDTTPTTDLRVLTADEYSSAWHAVEGSAGEPGADPATVLAAVLRVLDISPPARLVLGTTDQQPETAPTDRRARYAAAIRDTDGWVLDGGQHMVDAVMAVADAEQQEHVAATKYWFDAADERREEIARLRDEVGRLPVDRATVLREGADAIDATFTGPDLDQNTRYGADLLRRLADEVQQPETEAWPVALCDVMFEDGRQCAKPDGHRPHGSDDPHVPAPAPTEEPTR
ncbi:hypothetical protein [Streptomyces sp. NPDC088726]|uniref:hypothetical protein n=1 Tax=Streptomyces sp. NPDC088726 TaxID=3365874 RepID=UPI00382B341D